MFPCMRCGCCCQNLKLSPIYQHLDRGDGTCIHFDKTTHLCTIYNERPLECRVDAVYDIYFSEKMSREEFYNLNLQACQELRKQRREDSYV